MTVVIARLDNIRLLTMVGKLGKKRPMLELVFSRQLCCRFRATGTKQCDEWQIVTCGSKRAVLSSLSGSRSAVFLNCFTMTLKAETSANILQSTWRNTL